MGHVRTLAAGGLCVALLIAAVPGIAAALKAGDKAPEFTLQAADGKQVKLSDLTARGPVVLYTFIQAFTGT